MQLTGINTPVRQFHPSI